MEEFYKIIFGSYSAYEYLAVEFLAILGFSLMSFWNFIYRTDQESQISIKVWWSHKNYKNLFFFLSLIITMYLGLRFQIDLIGRFYEFINVDSQGVADKWFAFPLVGLFYRALVHQINKLKNKIMSK